MLSSCAVLWYESAYCCLWYAWARESAERTAGSRSLCAKRALFGKQCGTPTQPEFDQADPNHPGKPKNGMELDGLMSRSYPIS